MLQRIKKMLKKEKGFTLVELLAVIAILAIIVAIAIPAIGNVISDSETKAHKANVELIEDAARLAAISENKSSASYKIQDLVDNGYLDEIPESVDGNNYAADDTIKVEKSKATYTKYNKNSDDDQ